MSQALVAVAMGRKHADTVICNGRWVNVHSGEILPGTDVAIYGGRIAYVGPDASHTIGPQTRLIEARQRYLVPGLCDAHMHVESGMVTVTEFARAVIPHGTTSMFIDPHEIANVLGLPGVRLMHDEAATLPINVYVQMPSCVPSAPGLETPGASIGPEEVAEAMTWPGIIGLGEMMNFPGVFNGDDKMHAEMAATRRAGKVIGGHYASPDLGRAFHGYVAGGPADDHEGTRLEDAIARVRQGMKAMLRLGSAWYDVAAQVKAITDLGLDSRNFILCTDDSHSGTLVGEGHMDRVVRHAIAQGLRPITAIQMATLNTALHFGVERDIGSITPGRRADIVITGDLAELPIELVIAGGQVVAEDGRIAIDIPPYSYPEFAVGTVKLGKRLEATDFDAAATVDSRRPTADGRLQTTESGVLAAVGGRATGVALRSSVKVRVIGVVENQAPTKALERELPVVEGLLQPDPAQDVCRIALVERHRATGAVTNGFVSGFGFNTPCAVASTVAHDSHHMIVVGTDAADMARAANRLGEVGGGVVVFKEGREIALVELPIAGLMSNERAEIVAAKAERMVEAFAECGCTLHNAYMQLSLLALVVIPELRISDMGIVDVRTFEVAPLLI
jgi:adenine deaminase